MTVRKKGSRKRKRVVNKSRKGKIKWKKVGKKKGNGKRK